MRIARFEEVRTCSYGCCDRDGRARRRLEEQLNEIAKNHKVLKMEWHPHFFTFELVVFYEEKMEES